MANSKLFVVAGLAAWFLTFLLGFLILAPSTDDGYYVIASMGTALNGNPGFWIGNEFAPSFFLPTAFPFLYGILLKLTMILGFDFGPFGFRFYQFLFILLLPVGSGLMLRRLFPGDHAIRLLVFLTLLSVTYFVQSAASVRPEVLGALLFITFLALHETRVQRFELPTFVLAVGGTVHPVFTLLAFAVFGVGLIRRYQRFGFSNLRRWIGAAVAFGLPFAVLVIYYLINLGEYRQQIQGRTTILSTDILVPPAFIWDNLLFWNDPAGIDFGLYAGYPAFGFLSIMLVSTALVIYRRRQSWAHESLWLALPVVLVQWVVFLGLPAYLPYLAVSSFLGSLVIVLLWPRQFLRLSSTRLKWAFVVGCVGLSLVFIAFHAGKFVLISDDRLTPFGLHSVMTPLLEDGETKLYTNAAHLIPPLIDNFSEDGDIRLNFIYLDPDCLPPHLMERANEHAMTALANSADGNSLWGITIANSTLTADGARSIFTKGSRSTVTLIPSEVVYSDSKNLITRVSSVVVKLDEGVLCEQ